MPYGIHAYMKTKNTYNQKLANEFLCKLKALLPCFKGSLTEVKKPCIRPNCVACREGARHASYNFSFYEDGKRRCAHVPRELVPILSQGLENGRKLEKLMSQETIRVLKEYQQSKE